MKKIYKKYKDLKFRYKLIVLFILIGIVPITFIGTLWYNNTKRITMQQEENNINNYLSIAVSNMDNQLSIYDNLSDYIAFNQTISNVIAHEYDRYYDMYDKFTNVLDPMLSSLKYFHNDINAITIYTKNNIVKHDSTIAPISEIEGEKWYSELNDNNTHWVISKETKKALSVRNLPTLEKNYNYGVLYVDIDYNKLFKSFNTMQDSNYGVFIMDKKGEIIFEFNQFEKQNLNMKLSSEQFQKIRNETNQSSYTIAKRQSEKEEWTVFLYKPKYLSYQSVNSMFIRTIMVILIIIVVSFITTTILSKVMFTDLEKLRANMEEVENGNLTINIDSDSKDEIGTLIRGFRKMITQIKSLIEDVYESRIIQKEYEMRALQAQINPHFLYNSLSLINWMAIEAQQEDISKITLSLSSFYRTALNKGKNTLCVRDEIKNMTSYIDIQLMMHDYDFDVEINIDDEILGYKILNLLLQPLIENAIDHGIDLRDGGRGKIKIEGKKVNEDIIITVEDNGVGMDKEKCESILSKSSKGYGVRNVNERIKLFYGEKYYLYIESEINKGTKITMKLPIRN